jgi:hypothetical protein
MTQAQAANAVSRPYAIEGVSMASNLVILKGIVRGRMIELERETGFPDGQAVLVGISQTPADVSDLAAETGEDPAAALEAEKALQTIYEMRHTGRSVREL